MKGTTGFSVAVASALVASPALASDEDTQAWFTGTVVAPMAGASVQWENSWRLRQGTDQWLTRASFDTPLAKGVTAGAGLAYVHDKAGGDIRPHQQLTVVSGAFTFRTRLEEQFFPGPRGTQYRLRERALVALPIDHASRMNFTGEVLYMVHRGIGGGARRDQWRGGASYVRTVLLRLQGSIGYLAIYAPRTAAADRVTHVAQFGLTFRP